MRGLYDEAIQAAVWWTQLLSERSPREDAERFPSAGYDVRAGSQESRPDLTTPNLSKFVLALATRIDQLARADESTFSRVGVVVSCYHQPDGNLQWAGLQAGISSAAFPLLTVSVSRKGQKLLAGSGVHQYSSIIARTGVSQPHAA